MHVLITRPHDDGLPLKQKLEAMGVKATLAPVLALSYAKLRASDFETAQALIVTSRNGLKSLQHNCLVDQLASKPLYTVGQATADYATRVGFKHVRPGPGAAQGLATQIKQTRDPMDGALHHVAGAQLAFDLQTALNAEGFDVRQSVAYRADPITAWPTDVVKTIRSGALTCVILMSARTAEAFGNLVKAHDLVPMAAEMTFFCLSQAVKDQVRLALPAISDDLFQISKNPNLEELLALIDRNAPN